MSISDFFKGPQPLHPFKNKRSSQKYPYLPAGLLLNITDALLLQVCNTDLIDGYLGFVSPYVSEGETATRIGIPPEFGIPTRMDFSSMYRMKNVSCSRSKRFLNLIHSDIHYPVRDMDYLVDTSGLIDEKIC